MFWGFALDALQESKATDCGGSGQPGHDECEMGAEEKVDLLAE